MKSLATGKQTEGVISPGLSYRVAPGLRERLLGELPRSSRRRRPPSRAVHELDVLGAMVAVPRSSASEVGRLRASTGAQKSNSTGRGLRILPRLHERQQLEQLVRTSRTRPKNDDRLGQNTERFSEESSGSWNESSRVRRAVEFSAGMEMVRPT